MATVIKNVRVFNGGSLTELTNVIFDKGYITCIGPAAPEGTEIFDGQGQTLLPQHQAGVGERGRS